MSSIELLDKTRKIGKLLYNNKKGKVVFNDICRVMKDAIVSDVFVISRKGKVLGAVLHEENDALIAEPVGNFIDRSLNDRLLGVLSTQENANLEMFGFDAKDAKSHKALISPIVIAGERKGTLLVMRNSEDYTIDDIILCEYGANVVGLEILRSDSEEDAQESRKEQDIQAAFGSLSATERNAIVYVFEELGGTEGILITSRIADRVGITRSVIVNALRKFESAGIIESRSSGMRGTYIKVVNDCLFDEVERIGSES